MVRGVGPGARGFLHRRDIPLSDASGTARETGSLLRRCGEGDRQAFRQLYELHSPRLNGVALRLLRQPALAADAVHDAFVQVWQRAAEFDPARGDGGAWITGLVRYRSIDILRRRSRDEYGADVPEEADPAPGAFELLAGAEEAEALRRCLAELEDGGRRVVQLAFMDGLSHPELAVRLHAPLGTVKSWVRRALIALRRCLEA